MCMCEGPCSVLTAVIFAHTEHTCLLQGDIHEDMEYYGNGLEVKVLAVKPENLSLIPRAHIMEDENQLG